MPRYDAAPQRGDAAVITAFSKRKMSVRTASTCVHACALHEELGVTLTTDFEIVDLASVLEHAKHA